MAGHIKSSGNLHWNSPHFVKDLTWEFFGGPPDLDPASNPTSIMGANVNYMLPFNDGLKDPWNVEGRGPKTMVYLNCPFGRSYMKPDRSSVVSAGEFQKLKLQDDIMEWAGVHEALPDAHAKSSSKKERKLGAAFRDITDPLHEDFDAAFCRRLDEEPFVPYVYQAPLYSVHTDIADWTQRCVYHYQEFGTEIVSLLPAATDTKGHWQKLIFPTATKICFLAGRLCFLDEDGVPGGPCPMAMSLVYWGANGARFEKMANKHGSVR